MNIIKKIIILVLLSGFFTFSYAVSQIKVICDRDGESIYVNDEFKTECDKGEPVPIMAKTGKYTVIVKKDNANESYYYYKKSFRIGDGVQKILEVKTNIKNYKSIDYLNKILLTKKIDNYLKYKEKLNQTDLNRLNSKFGTNWEIALFSHNNNSRIDKIVEIDNKFLISGGINTEGFIAKIDKNGKVIWKEHVLTGDGIFGDKYHLIKLPNNNLFFLTLPSTGNLDNIFFSKVTKEGIIKEKGKINFFPNTYKVLDNSILIGGLDWSDTYKKYIGVLEKYDTNLNKVWKRIYIDKEGTWIDSIIYANNYIYLIDWLGNCIKIDNDGRQLKKIKLFSDDDKIAIKLDNKNFLLLYKYKNKIEKVKYNGEKILSKPIEAQITSVTKVDDNILIGGYLTKNKVEKAFIEMLSPDLKVIFKQIFGDVKLNTKVTSLYYTNNNNLLIGIERENNALLVKFDKKYINFLKIKNKDSNDESN